MQTECGPLGVIELHREMGLCSLPALPSSCVRQSALWYCSFTLRAHFYTIILLKNATAAVATLCLWTILLLLIMYSHPFYKILHFLYSWNTQTRPASLTDVLAALFFWKELFSNMLVGFFCEILQTHVSYYVPSSLNITLLTCLSKSVIISFHIKQYPIEWFLWNNSRVNDSVLLTHWVHLFS